MLSQDQVEAYRRDGFIVVEGVLSDAEIGALREATDALVEGSRAVDAHTDVYDLEPGHTRDEPRVRRIKTPHLQHPVYDAVMRHERILAILRQLVGPAIRYDTSKLNMKAPGYGAAVEWHQDWAFYPHTNADLCAVGVMMDDCGLENGPLLCLPGSHEGPIHDHHADGAFCGAIDPTKTDIDFAKAVPCTGKAGSISIHHVMTVHGSAVNTSRLPRRLLLYQYSAADAWPLVAASQPKDWEDWTSRVICGRTDEIVPRVERVPVRLPLPGPRFAGSIYETQRELKNAYFAPPARAGAAAM
ncbi:MAG TPA: phytanoyl-CoA dioxygenase family protein [Microvirga sp.]|jgi:ectoine hydroxylase-related dioxygenase (phytanoyl-CoA dioxygenase family)|nr:phytanoyl-CoA dioxygenase family protein [Microvirga sp.]